MFVHALVAMAKASSSEAVEEPGLQVVFAGDSLASAEKDERLSEVYRRLAVVERKHADRWRKKLEDAGETLPNFAPS